MALRTVVVTNCSTSSLSGNVTSPANRRRQRPRPLVPDRRVCTPVFRLVWWWPSMTSARHMPSAAAIMIRENGRALAMVMVCSAPRPPASRRAAATAPSLLAQNTRCQTGVTGAPPEARESITSEPESEEVTKKVTMRITVRKETTAEKGSRSNSLNSATAWSACTSPIKV